MVLAKKVGLDDRCEVILHGKIGLEGRREMVLGRKIGLGSHQKVVLDRKIGLQGRWKVVLSSWAERSACKVASKGRQGQKDWPVRSPASPPRTKAETKTARPK